MTRSSIALVSLVVSSLVMTCGAASSSFADESKTKDKSPATRLLESGAELTPADKAALEGYQLLDQGKVDEAMKSFDEALRLKPGFAEAWVGLAEVLEGQGRDLDAVAALRKAIALREGYVGALFNAAVILRRLGRLDEAEALLREVVPTLIFADAFESGDSGAWDVTSSGRAPR